MVASPSGTSGLAITRAVSLFHNGKGLTLSYPTRKTKSAKRAHAKQGTRDANFMPKHIAHSFETELVSLIGTVSKDHGVKGAYLESELLSKYADPNGTPPDVRASNAITKWLGTEKRNRSTNARLQLGDEDFGWVTSDLLVGKTREFLKKLLGPLIYPDIFNFGSHTNGASTRVRRGPSAAIQKHSGEAHVSSSALKHWLAYSSNTVLSDQVLCIQDSSVLFTVPKKTDIDRVACKEPEINMFLQRTVGSYIGRRLRRFGIDLNDQSTNKELARTALRRGLATIDLSSASDTISKQLVFELLPFEWWSLLDDLRVHSTMISNERHELEMFSSMGNGFTFELESAIFWALARSIMYYSGVKGRVSVYGDDIIVPCAIAPRLARTFSWFGFIVNQKKSNWSGPFRESCGGHYHLGLDITPFYIREPVTAKTDIIRLLNRLLEWDARGVGFITDPNILAFHKRWSAVIPKNLHGGQDPEDPTALVTGSRPTNRLAPITKSIEVDDQHRLICWLATRESLGDNPLEIQPLKQLRYKVTKMPWWTVRTTWDPWFIQGSYQCNSIP